MAVFPITRRKLLVAFAGGTAIAGGAGLWLGIDRISNERFRKPVDRPGFSPNVYLGVLEDGQVQIWLTRSEMGQGVSTALPMLVAEELDADWARVSVHQARAGGEHDFGKLFTAASSSVSSMWIELRRAGALAREMLVAAAAARWAVSASDCRTESGAVFHGPNRLQYGELVEEAASQWVPIRPALKEPDRFRLIGSSPQRVDTPQKVTGAAQYGSDVLLTGMVRAVIDRPPVRGQVPLDVDDRAARGVSGVLDVFPVSSGVAVIAETTHAALKARAALSVRWSAAPHALNTANAAPRVRSAAGSAATSAIRTGDPAGLQNFDPILAATYEVPLLAHACMEPMNCTVDVKDEHCEIWVGSQAPNGARAAAAAAAGLPLENVTVNVTQLGGGFGRRTGQDFVIEAVEIGVHLGRPVQLLWTREDDLGHGAYRDAAALKLAAGLAADGLPAVLSCGVATTSPAPVPSMPGMGPMMGLDNLAYQWQTLDVRWMGVEVPLPVSIWRSVGYSYTMFAVECFMDELAASISLDPLALRKSMLPDGSTLSRCLDAVAEDSAWHGRDDRALGLACYNFGRTSVAMVAEVAATEPAELGTVADPHADWRVTRVWCVVDCGTVVHPDAAAAQIEGGIVFGLSAALYESVTAVDGRVTSCNFDTYRLARMRDAPEMSVRFLPSNRTPSGLGEASTPGIAPAVANALYRFGGRRIRSLPLKS